MSIAVLVSMALIIAMPERLRFGPAWMLPLFAGALLVALIAGDPGRITRRSSLLRIVALSLIGLLVLAALASTAYLIRDLIEGSSLTNEPGPLLSAGVSVWWSNLLAFALLYWELDRGGPIGRLEGTLPYSDFAFPQQINPDLAPPDWRPRFLDYFYVSITNSVAFSPTDTMPLADWAKLAMGFQAMVSLALVSLVVARAVNAFS
jgi:hypothetical protein